MKIINMIHSINISVVYTLIAILGACIGSFINMAAYRIPKILYFNFPYGATTVSGKELLKTENSSPTDI